MNKPLKYLTTFVAATLILTCCTKQKQEITSITYGTSYGECLGYCLHTVTLTEGEVTYQKWGWVDTLDTITCIDQAEPEVFNTLQGSLAETNFTTLPESYGCPDCADGGAAWITITLENGRTHKVLFEKDNPPAILVTPAATLDTLLEGAFRCGAFEIWPKC